MSYFADLSAGQKAAYDDAYVFFSGPSSEKQFAKAIESIASLQSWLEYFVVADRFSPAVRTFFLEAVNDSILSYVFARVGTWRPALQSLRSTLENSLLFLYYKDHPVELALWHRQKHKMGFTELAQYFRAHPTFLGKSQHAELVLAPLVTTYSQLSQAVHGSVEHFRMVVKAGSDELPAIHVKSTVDLSRYQTMVRKLIGTLNQLMVVAFSDILQGTALPALRGAIGAALTRSNRAHLKKTYGVVLH